MTLPPHLAERILQVTPGPAPGTGSFVLYWMRTAVRGHENPALDVALATARAHGVPVLVLQVLPEVYPFASDRHHRFILEGARDVAIELRERGVPYAFHLERPGHRSRPLLPLAQDAMVVVTEDMPVRPWDRWTEALARKVDTPVWAVDTAAVVPFRSVRAKDTLRAYRYRDATRAERGARTLAPWPEEAATPTAAPPDGAGLGAPVSAVSAVSATPGLPELPFEPVPVVDLPDAEIADLIGTCDIDHGVAPVPHTPGGSRAGYARWEAFKARGLRAYAATRNDALKPGVSRMSAYLHHGHVSPFRLSREAAALGGKGAEKYLDELQIWRELAYAYCAHHPDHESVETLPGWALQTLRDHVGDPREVLDLEVLAHARTGDRLWDAAQRSLLIHGELHNNVRMTWGKAIPLWSPDPETALARLIELNHRYALDGQDPASYGGLLWCLGQFDRPFTPEVPVLGSVRPRPTAHHARRLDVEEYERRTGAPAWSHGPQVEVIGTGPAAEAAAEVLARHGLTVRTRARPIEPGGGSGAGRTGEDPEAWIPLPVPVHEDEAPEVARSRGVALAGALLRQAPPRPGNPLGHPEPAPVASPPDQADLFS